MESFELELNDEVAKRVFSPSTNVFGLKTTKGNRNFNVVWKKTGKFQASQGALLIEWTGLLKFSEKWYLENSRHEQSFFIEGF